MNKEEIAKQIEETEIKLRELREALSKPVKPVRQPQMGEVWLGKSKNAILVLEDYTDGNGLAMWLSGPYSHTTLEISIDESLGDEFIGTFSEVFIRRDDVAKDYVLKADILALTDFNDDSLARCIDKGLTFEGCVCLHKQLTDLIN
jgi:hypothetical protein